MQPTQLNLNYKNPIMATDNFVIRGLSDGSVDILFLQVTSEGPQDVQADVVAGARLNTLAKLEDMKKVIEEHLEKEKNKEA